MFQAAEKRWERRSVHPPAAAAAINLRTAPAARGQFTSPSPRLSLCIHEMPLFGHFSVKACSAIHSFLVPNNGLQASGLSLCRSLCICSSDRDHWSYSWRKKVGKEWKCWDYWFPAPTEEPEGEPGDHLHAESNSRNILFLCLSVYINWAVFSLVTSWLFMGPISL